MPSATFGQKPVSLGSIQSCLAERRLDFEFREATIFEGLDDGNTEFDSTRAHAYGGADHTNGGLDFFVIRTDVELKFSRENDKGKELREPANPLAGKGGRVKPGKCLTNSHHDIPVCTLKAADGGKPLRNDRSFWRNYVMGAFQFSPCGNLVLYRRVVFKQKRIHLGSNPGVSDHGTCHSLKNDANHGEHLGLDKADIMMNGSATGTRPATSAA